MASDPTIAERVHELKSKAPSGFAMAFHVNFTRPAFIIRNYPEAWTQIYSARGFVMVDPTVKWGFDNTGSVRWSDLSALDTDGVLTAAAEHGLNFGLTHVTDAGGTKTMASFARADREFTDAEVEAISDHIDEIHLATQANAALTPADMKALRADGISVTQA